MNRVRIDAGPDKWPAVLNSQESGIDRGYIGGRNRDQARLIEFSSLEVSEIEGAIATKWTTRTRTVLCLREWKRRVRQRVRGIEALLPGIAVPVHLKRIRT